MIRLPNIPPRDLGPNQRALFDKMRDGVRQHLTGFTTQRADGAMIGPFNGMLNFPEFGGPVFDMFLALAGGTVLPKEVREIVILATGGRLGALYEIYSHETIASKAGMSQAKIRTLASGERPIDLTEAETIAYDITAVLHRGHQLPASLYKAAVSAFGAKGVAEIAYLVGCYTTICSICNVFDVDLTGTEEG
jgi:hypothetical protein